jgi:hypothetical protein
MHGSSSLSNSSTLILELLKNSSPVIKIANLVLSAFVIWSIATANQVCCCCVMESLNLTTFRNSVGSTEHAPENIFFRHSRLKRPMLDRNSSFFDLDAGAVSIAKFNPSQRAFPTNSVFEQV